MAASWVSLTFNFAGLFCMEIQTQLNQKVQKLPGTKKGHRAARPRHVRAAATPRAASPRAAQRVRSKHLLASRVRLVGRPKADVPEAAPEAITVLYMC